MLRATRFLTCVAPLLSVFAPPRIVTANAGGDTYSIKIFVDVPARETGPVLGAATFAGWAIDDIAAISTVAIAIDGISYGNASYGVNRPDVCVAFPNRAGCPNVGWSFVMDTGLLADGTHSLAVTATSVTGESTTVTAGFATANLTTSNPIKMTIDIPNSSSQSFTGTVHFGGWAVDENIAIRGVTVLV